MPVSATISAVVTRVQDRIARRLGLDPAQRTVSVRSMLKIRTGEGIGYWLQLMMAAALATLGLALDSTAVVIGAMLIAPLMRPIVELAMGLATGSAPLVFRAGIRTVASILAVGAAAAAITWLLPFHEVTRELAARTAPSLLDLFVAAACALAGAYATMFASSEMASTAAGTSIGISLVPPLCTLGYALSVGDGQMAIGAALLFTANVTGIITVAGVVFLVVGFGQVDIHTEELAADADTGVASRIGRNWSLASRRLGAVSRLVLPALLLGAIFIPLRRAVGEMARRSQIRQQVEELLTSTKFRIAQSSISLDASGVLVRVVIVGDSHAAQQLDEELRRILANHGEDEPRLSVWAVPDAKALGALATRIDDLPPPIVAAPARELTQRTPAELTALVDRTWPKHGTGALVATWLVAGKPMQIQVIHLGAPLGEAGTELLRQAIAPTEQLAITERSLEPIEAATLDGIAWVGGALALVDLAGQLPGMAVCVVVPSPPPPVTNGRRPPVVEDPRVAITREIVEHSLGSIPRVVVTRGDRWSATPVLGVCTPPSPAIPPTPPK